MVESIVLVFEHADAAKTIELELLSKFTCINGRDSGEGKSEFLDSKESIVVFADFSAIGRAYRILLKRCASNGNILFYGYDSFEHLLCSSMFKHRQTGVL